MHAKQLQTFLHEHTQAKEITKYTRVEWLIVRRVMGVWGGAQAKSGRKGKREDSGQLFKDQN